MRKLSARRPSPALVISVIALFVALGGTGYAASKLARNSVGSAQIRTGAVGTSEVKDHSLRLKDFRSGQIPAGARGATGPAGANGHDGAPGARGPSDAYVSGAVGPTDDASSASVTVPAGDYVVAASAEVFNYRDDSTHPTVDGEAHCSLTSNGDTPHGTGTFATVPKDGYESAPWYGGLATVSQNTAFHLTSGDTITYACENAGDGTKDPSPHEHMQYANMRVTAIQVGTLHSP